MSVNLKLTATLRYGTFRGLGRYPSAADRAELERLIRLDGGVQGEEVLFARTEPTETLSWPTKYVELSYSAFHPESASLSALAQVWKEKLESAYNIRVHVDASTR